MCHRAGNVLSQIDNRDLSLVPFVMGWKPSEKIDFYKFHIFTEPYLELKAEHEAQYGKAGAGGKKGKKAKFRKDPNQSHELEIL